MFKLLFGAALARWLQKQMEEAERTESPTSDGTPPAESEPDDKSELPEEPPAYVYPRVQRRAMGSLFEVYLAGTDWDGLVAAGEEALNEIDRLEAQLSHYRDDNDIARLNKHAVEQWVRLEPRLYNLLKHCGELSAETDGAFDITAGPLVKAWGFFRGEGRIPSDAEIEEVLQNVGFHRILFDDEDDLVYFTAPKLEINLGAVGKGYAMDMAAETLRAYHVESAVIHGGQSTIYALGAPPVPEGENGRGEERETESDAAGRDDIIRNPQSAIRNHEGWPFTIKDPRDHETPLQTVYLQDEAISTSGNYEQFFDVDGVRYSHIIDPRTGRPTRGMISVSVIAPSAADSDALSTAFFVMGRERTQEYCKSRPNIRVIMVEERPDEEIEVTQIGF
jgi:FAD:protein FMN transferase